MDTSGEIFVGITKTHLRMLSFSIFRNLKSLGYEKVVLPCVGEFNLANIAVEAGFSPDQIYSSDISLFSSLLGCIFSGQPIESLNFELSPEVQAEVDACEDEISKVATVLYNMRLIKLSKISYRANLFAEFVRNRDDIIGEYKRNIEEADTKLHGLHYEVADVREIVRDYGEKTVIVTFPPLFAGGYGKMFDFGEVIKMDVNIEEFHPKEFPDLFNATKEYETGFVTFSDKFVSGISNDDIIMVKEYKVGKYDVCYANHHELVPESVRKKIITFSRHKLKPLKIDLFSESDTITKDSVVKFHSIKAENALYYRDMWVHNLGVTSADCYYALTIDGKLAAVCGVLTSGLSGLSKDYVFEQFGMAVPVSKYPSLARLLEWCMTSSDFKKVLYKTVTGINRLYSLNGVKTVCLSKNQKVKSHHGIFEKLSIKYEKKLGMNKIEYYARFRKDTLSDCVATYLDELKRRKGV